MKVSAVARQVRALVTTLRRHVDSLFAYLEKLDTVQLLVVGYLSYIVVGWLLLCLPVCHASPGATWLDHLFTATSAVSTTGLVTVSTSDSYSWIGEAVILLLIQLGGLGYMTLSSFTVLAVAGDLSPLRHRISSATLTLPQGFEIRAFLRTIIGFTIGIEAVGAVLLYPSFAAAGAHAPVWQAVFHSVSAFSTAGFGLFNNSLEDYRQDVWLNLVVAALSYLGAIGFIVLSDVWRSLTHRRLHATLTSKIILWSTFWISAIGTVLFALEEPQVGELSAVDRWLASFFQVMTAGTTVGFNTLPIGSLSASSLLLLTLIMVVGASPSGTGGGLKTTTISVLWAEMIGVLRRRPATTFFGRLIPEARRRAAVASVLFYLLVLAAGVYALALTEQHSLPDLTFEATSALGTVGLSRGITGLLTPTGKWIVILLMFLGRLGPVVFGMAMLRPSPASQSVSEEDLAV